MDSADGAEAAIETPNVYLNHNTKPPFEQPGQLAVDFSPNEALNCLIFR